MSSQANSIYRDDLANLGSELLWNILNPVGFQMLKTVVLKGLRVSIELFLLFARVGVSERSPNHSFCSYC